jgi:DNA-directed RNA polymerase subunit H (RpoH/RPB5)
MLPPIVLKAYKTVNDMLIKRGYNHTYSDIEYTSFESLEQMTIKTSKIIGGSDGINKHIIVYFPEGESKDGDKNGHIGVKHIRQYVDKAKLDDIHDIILIVENDITTFGKKEIDLFRSSKPSIKIEIFKYADLQIDVTMHVLVPKHRLLSEEEKNTVLKEYSSEPRMFPKLSIDDPQSKFYGFEKHNMIEITNFSETGGIYVKYRIVG